MHLVVCDQEQAIERLAEFGAEDYWTHVLSIQGTRQQDIIPNLEKIKHHLEMQFDDIRFCDVPGGPSIYDARMILEFGKSITAQSKVLVHCKAGISRSTAAAFGLMVQQRRKISNSGYVVEDCLYRLQELRPELWLNQALVKYFDDELKCNGAMLKALYDILGMSIRMVKNETIV